MENPAQPNTRAKSLPFFRAATLFLSIAGLICQVLLLNGCVFRRRPSIPWATAVQVKPTLPVSTGSASDAVAGAPDLNLEMPPFAAVLVPVRSAPVPPRPRVSSSPLPNTPAADAEKSEVPVITQQLTGEQSAAAQQEMNQSLDAAEKKLASARGQKLNAAQSDLVSKIRGFVKDAREAAQAGDWGRARSLAKKAEVLSAELVLSP
jgi:hypothetical protein